jgi:hypothetical protein
VYYRLYADDYEIPSKVAIDPKKPSLGRIQADFVAPPHSPASIKRYISRLEKSPALTHADLFTNISSDTPLKEGYISILPTDAPGLSPNWPMAIVQSPPPISDGRYFIINRRGSTVIGWAAELSPITTVQFWSHARVEAAKETFKHIKQVNRHSPITQVFKG